MQNTQSTIIKYLNMVGLLWRTKPMAMVAHRELPYAIGSRDGRGVHLCLRRLACLPDFGRHLGWKTSGSEGILRGCTQDSLSCYPPQYWQLQSYWCSATNFTPMVLTA